MPEKLITQYKRYVRQRLLFIFYILVALLLIVIVSLVSGTADITLKKIVDLLINKSDAFIAQIILKIRLPRIIGAILAGTALAVSGAVFQSLLRNPLASPFTLGISGASAFGAAFAIIALGAGSNYAGSNDVAIINNPYIVSASAFVWSLCSVGIILLLARFKGSTPEVMILAGIIISSLFGAGISAMQYFSNNIQLASIIFWTFGDLGRASWRESLILGVTLIPVLIYFFWQSWNYKSLQPGDEYAKSLGVKVNKVRLSGMVVASLATAIVVSFFGIIAFVGLVVPHIVRRIIGSDEQFLLPASALFGGVFLLLSDTLARTIISPVILPVGILTSFIGAPLFLFILLRRKGQSFWS